MKKFAVVVATLGLALAMIGAGVSATFTQSGSVAEQVAVGTMDVRLSSNLQACTPGEGLTITCQIGPILASSGNVPIQFNISEYGSIPVNVSITSSTPWPSNFALGAETYSASVAGNSTGTYNGTLYWSGLDNDWLNWSGTVVTFTVSATA
jgi:hypothetical protein